MEGVTRPFLPSRMICTYPSFFRAALCFAVMLYVAISRQLHIYTIRLYTYKCNPYRWSPSTEDLIFILVPRFPYTAQRPHHPTDDRGHMRSQKGGSNKMPLCGRSYSG